MPLSRSCDYELVSHLLRAWMIDLTPPAERHRLARSASATSYCQSDRGVRWYGYVKRRSHTHNQTDSRTLMY